MRVGSLFSGAGGLDLAVEAMFGGRTVWHCETDSAAGKVLAARWPDVPNLGDITAVDWSTVKPVDVLCGGFPCQDVSAAGKRAGIRQGTRSGLWLEFAEVIHHLRPAFVVIENVRGLLSGYAHRAVESADLAVGDRTGRPLLRAAGAVLGDLADLGYDAQWATVSAASVGAPHRRERVFILATDAARPRRSWVDGCSSGTEARRGRQWQPPGSPWGSIAADAACDGRDEGWSEPAGLVGGSDAALSGHGHVDLLPTPAACRSGNNQSPSPGAAVRPSLDSITALLPTPTTQDGANTAGPSQFERNTLPLNAAVTLLPPPAAADGSRGPDYQRRNRDGSGADDLITTTVEAVAAGSWGKYEPAIRRWEVLTRPAPPPTEPNTKGNPRLAAAFSEWMQGWPHGWVTDPRIGISRNEQLRIIGNGVCPQQAYAALVRLLGVVPRRAA